MAPSRLPPILLFFTRTPHYAASISHGISPTQVAGIKRFIHVSTDEVKGESLVPSALALALFFFFFFFFY
jgi:hypothetical protein